jgi:small subunit ribosomal protein S1
MLAEYDEQGNYKYPEGFNPDTNEWIEGFEAQREAWEQEYALAQSRWEAHKEQVRGAIEAEANAPEAAEQGGSSFSSESDDAFGTLADDASLAALREKLSGN